VNRTALAFLAAALVLPLAAGCRSRAKPVATEERTPAIRGKARAAVSIQATLADGVGRVTVRFDAAATDLRVDVWGVDGLAVSSAATPIDGARFEAGDTTTFDVAYTAAPGRSALAVSVSGDFAGNHRGSVVSFEIVSPAADRKNGLTAPAPARPGTVVETDDGDRVKVLPAPGD
jgi:hypothetical protein